MLKGKNARVNQDQVFREGMPMPDEREPVPSAKRVMPQPKPDIPPKRAPRPEPEMQRMQPPPRPMTPEEEAMGNSLLQDVLDEKNRKKSEEAYNKARTSPMKKGGSVSSASKRADGCATKGKTKGRFV